MSFLSTIENAAKTTAKFFLTLLKKAQQEAPTVAQVADRVIPWAKMVVDGVLVAEGGGAIVPEANAIIAEINKDLDVACATIYDIGATPSVTALLTAVVDNIGTLLTAGHVKDAANVTLIKNVMASLLSLVGVTAPVA
jgi:hypothetical protein